MKSETGADDPQRVIAFIDAMNLYHGLLELNPQGRKEDRRFLWLDIPALIKTQLLDSQQLVRTNYFTAMRSQASSANRQRHYINALAAIHGESFRPKYGRFQRDDVTCHQCQHTWPDYEEKKSDVNIAVSMLTEIDQYDVAILLTGDSDLVPPALAVAELGKRVVVATIPTRRSREFTKLAQDTSVNIVERQIWERHLKKSRLPAQFKAAGKPFKRPPNWA